MVNGMVAKRIGTSKMTGAVRQMTQMAMFTSTLTKPLYLSPPATMTLQSDSGKYMNRLIYNFLF